MLQHITPTLAALALAASLIATPKTAQAAPQCTEVTRPDGSVVLACKNVPDRPTPKPKPKPAPEVFVDAGSPQPAAPAQTPPASAKPTEAAPAPAAANTEPTTATATQLATLRNQAFSAAAQAAALAPLFPSAIGKTTVNASLAAYGGQQAIGITFAHRPTQSLVFSAGVSAGPSRNNLVQISAGFQF